MENLKIENFIRPVKILLDRKKTRYLIKEKVDDHSPRLKDDTIAEHFYKLGNSEFKSHNYHQSILMYTKCIGYAKYGTEQMLLGYENRLAALLKVGELQDSLNDIHHILCNDYPTKLRPKIYLSKIDVLYKLGRHEEAEFVSQELEAYLESHKTTISKDYDYFKSELKKTVVEGSKSKISNVSNEDNKAKIIYDKHPCSENLSVKLSIQTSEQKGRYLEANSKIKQGEILIQEHPFAFIVLPDYFYSCCSNCLKRCLSLISCDYCSEVFWCSITCKEKNWKEIHQYECGYIELIESTGIGRLAFHMLLKAGLSGVIKCVEEENVLSVNENQLRTDYDAVYHLVSHLNKIEDEDLMQYGFTAVLLLTYLEEKTAFFKNPPSSKVDKEINEVVGGVILKHLLQSICNGHAITDLEEFSNSQEKLFVQSLFTKIATAIYPVASLMNHACEPNIINSFVGPCLVVKAVEDIPKGGEILNCYGPHFARHPEPERQEALQFQYHFTCDCKRCKSKSTENLPECLKDERKPCAQLQNSLNEVYYILESGDIRRALEISLKTEIEHQTLGCTNGDVLNNVRDNIAKCFAMLGNYRKSSEYVEKSLPFVSEKYGPNSIEMGNELQKLTDMLHILFASEPKDEGVKKKLSDYLSQAKSIFQLSYGEWSRPYKEVETKLANMTI